MMKKILFLSIFLTVFIFWPGNSKADSWLSGYNYRKQINIQGTADGVQTNYQLKLTIYKGGGSDYGSSVYLAGHALNWSSAIPNDIRFTKADGSTQLDYWIESSDANSAIVWVEFDSIPVSPNSTFYIYYGNAAAGSASNGVNTFRLFDDFDGSSIDASKWYSGGSVVVSGGKVTLTGPETYSYAYIAAGSYSYQYGSFRFLGTILQSQFYSYILWGCCTPGRAGWTRVAPSPLFADTWISGSVSETDLGNVGVDTEYIWDIQWTPSWVKYYRNSTLDATHGSFSGATYPEFVIYGDGAGHKDIMEVKWAMLRNLTANEPTFGAWGIEQNLNTLTVAKTGTGLGTVTSNPAGIDCGSDCSENYASGTSITLTPNPSGGSVFTGWSGDCSGTGNCTLTMTAAKNVTANFNTIIPCQNHNVSGYAWSENIGWISFSCKNGSNPGDYGVDISASTGNFSGYAWSENIGWIDFAPAGPYPNSPNYSACLDFSGSGQTCDGLGNNKVGGWARALAYGGGWDGWIKLRGSNYGVDFNVQSGELSGYAWSDMVIGWINFKGVNYGVVTTAKLPPSVSIIGEAWDNCTFQGRSAPILNWDYQDGTQAAYQVQIDNSSASFPSPEVDTGQVLSSSHSYAPTYTFDWNDRYWWRVKAKNQQGVWSNWSNTGNFDTPIHNYPWPGFSWLPQEPTQKEVVVFDPEATNVYYLWTFNQGALNTYQPTDGTSETSEEPHIKFLIANNTVKLKVTDKTPQAYSCEYSEQAITAQLPLPEYKETPPIIWLRKMLASVGLYIF